MLLLCNGIALQAKCLYDIVVMWDGTAPLQTAVGEEVTWPAPGDSDG